MSKSDKAGETFNIEWTKGWSKGYDSGRECMKKEIIELIWKERHSKNICIAELIDEINKL